MVELYILEIINNGRVIQKYQNENIEEILGYKYDDAVIHIDNVVVKK